MRFYFISPIGALSPGLFSSFEKTFIEKGHTIVNDVKGAEIIFFDSHSGYLPYNWEELNYVTVNRLPVAYFDAFDYHSDSSKHWFGFNNWSELRGLLHQDWAKFLFIAKDRCKPFIYFMRKMQTNAHYGSLVRPLELCQYADHNFPPTTKEELSSRPFDICWIGAKSIRRENMVYSLLSDSRLKVKYIFTEERIPHHQWLDEHRSAKLFLEADGGGVGSERPYQLMTISTMLKQKNHQLIVNDFEDGVDCLKAGDENGKATNGDIDRILEVVNSPDKLFSIYTNGIQKINTFFSEEHRANYVLSIIETAISNETNRQLYESYFANQ